MRKIAATYLYLNEEKILKNAILTLADDGEILAIEQHEDGFSEEAGLEFYSGMLVPGFVNAHCHLELSHLKGKIEEKTGIGGFIGRINTLREDVESERNRAMQTADRRMWAAGTVAVGDISNSDSSLQIKKDSKISYHTFVEVFGFHPSRAERAFDHALEVNQHFSDQKLSSSIVPHSPYSVSEALFLKIKEWAVKKNGILSIHNQESKGEADFYKKGTGPIANHLVNNLGIDISHWQPSGKSSLQSILNYFPPDNTLLLVHNTFTNQQDLDSLKEQRSLVNTHFVLCPNSNLYIENTLPPVPLFVKNKLNICFGTDSLASNHELSILEEMKTIQKQFPEIETTTLLKWASENGAQALGMEHVLGSFQIGKKPGVNLITGFDLKTFSLSENTRVKRLL